MTRTLEEEGSSPPLKRHKLSLSLPYPFHPSLVSTLETLKEQHAKSEPYLHAVVGNLFEKEFLKKAREEIVENVSFREKETDICESLLTLLLLLFYVLIERV